SHPLRRVHECRGTRSRYPRISRSSQHPSDPFRLDQIRRRHSRKGRQRATSVRVTTLEALLNDLIWAIVGLKIEDGRLLTERQDATRLIAILRGLAERYLVDDGTPSPRSRFLESV